MATIAYWTSGGSDLRFYWDGVQTFTVPATGQYDVTSILLKLANGAPQPTTTTTIYIFAVNDLHQPTGASLATIGSISSSQLTTTLTWKTFTFAGECRLQPSTEYAIVISTDGDTDHYVRWDGASGYSGGVAWCQYTEGGNWAGVSDRSFAIYGDLVSEAPGKPTNPSPTDAEADITLDQTPLSWNASDPAADTYEIYFREQGDEWTLVGEAQEGVEWTVDFGTLDYGITYEWRIDATNEFGTTTGDTWSFSCIDFDPPNISYRLIDGGSGSGPYDDPPGTRGTDWEYTGVNNMYTVKRLIAAANNAIWYGGV